MTTMPFSCHSRPCSWARCRPTEPTTDLGRDAAPELLTVPEVMAQLRLGRTTVYSLLRRRELASITIGRARRIPCTALHTYLNHQLENAS